jgi:hypothetical protein
LYEALAAGGEVVDDLGRDQVDVGALPGMQASAAP